MREVNKFFFIVFGISAVILSVALANDESFIHADSEVSTDPSKMFSSNFPVVDGQYIRLDGPTSKTSFLNSALTSNSYVPAINTNTARLKTGDTVSVYSTISNQHIGDYTISIKGDLNGDGEVNANDVAKIYQYYKNRISLSRAAQIAGDVTDSGGIGLGDLAKMYQYTKGKIGGLN